MASQPVGVQPAGSQWAVPNQMAGTQPGSAGMAGQMPGTQPGSAWTCPGCGTSNTGKFCGECGHPRPRYPVDLCLRKHQYGKILQRLRETKALNAVITGEREYGSHNLQMPQL